MYCQFRGPHYETPAEVQMAKTIGGHIVGMSTALEAIAARQAGMEILGMSLITNLAAGIQQTPLSHEEVIEAGRDAEPVIGGLLARIVAELLSRGTPDVAAAIAADADRLALAEAWIAQDPDPETRAELAALVSRACATGDAAASADLADRFDARLDVRHRRAPRRDRRRPESHEPRARGAGRRGPRRLPLERAPPGQTRRS